MTAREAQVERLTSTLTGAMVLLDMNDIKGTREQLSTALALVRDLAPVTEPAGGDVAALARAVRAVLPPVLRAEVLAYLDPVTPFLRVLRGDEVIGPLGPGQAHDLGSTHWTGCETHPRHRDCAIALLLAALDDVEA